MPILLSLLANARVAIALAAFLAGIGSGLYIRGRWDASALESALKSQETALIAKCESDKAKTERIANDLVEKNADLSRRVAEYRRLHKAKPVLVTVPTSSDDGKAGSGSVGTHVVDSESLTSYAELAEQYRLRLVSCQNFVRLERIQ